MNEERLTRTQTDIDFWDRQWDDMNIGFHINKIHPMLSKHIQLLVENREKLRFFFPLCGKAWDLKWVASMGHDVIGVESNQKAIEQFFNEMNIKYDIDENNDFKIFKSQDNKIKLYCGDLFKFTNELEESMDCVWDRGSLVALPEELRDRYSVHILSLLKPDFRYLLDAFTYDRSLYPGPPHSVDLDELKRLYGKDCSIEVVDSFTNLNITFYGSFSKDPTENPPKEVVYLLKSLN